MCPASSRATIGWAIACTKSALVVLFFMHLWDHGGANRLVFATSIVFVALLNPLLGLVRPVLALRRSELAVVYIMEVTS